MADKYQGKTTSSEVEREIGDMLKQQANLLLEERIERLSSLIVAEWNPDLKEAKIIKPAGKSLEVFGHARNGSIYLYPEEALYLVETKKLALLHDNSTMAVQLCYAALLNTPSGPNHNEYRVFHHFCLNGYKVFRYEHEENVSFCSTSQEIQNDNIPEQSCAGTGEQDAGNPLYLRNAVFSAITQQIELMKRRMNIDMKVSYRFSNIFIGYEKFVAFIDLTDEESELDDHSCSVTLANFNTGVSTHDITACSGINITPTVDSDVASGDNVTFQDVSNVATTRTILDFGATSISNELVNRTDITHVYSGTKIPQSNAGVGCASIQGTTQTTNELGAGNTPNRPLLRVRNLFAESQTSVGSSSGFGIDQNFFEDMTGEEHQKSRHGREVNRDDIESTHDMLINAVINSRKNLQNFKEPRVEPSMTCNSVLHISNSIAREPEAYLGPPWRSRCVMEFSEGPSNGNYRTLQPEISQLQQWNDLQGTSGTSNNVYTGLSCPEIDLIELNNTVGTLNRSGVCIRSNGSGVPVTSSYAKPHSSCAPNSVIHEDSVSRFTPYDRVIHYRNREQSNFHNSELYISELPQRIAKELPRNNANNEKNVQRAVVANVDKQQSGKKNKTQYVLFIYEDGERIWKLVKTKKSKNPSICFVDKDGNKKWKNYPSNSTSKFKMPDSISKNEKNSKNYHSKDVVTSIVRNEHTDVSTNARCNKHKPGFRYFSPEGSYRKRKNALRRMKNKRMRVGKDGSGSISDNKFQEHCNSHYCNTSQSPASVSYRQKNGSELQRCFSQSKGHVSSSRGRNKLKKEVAAGCRRCNSSFDSQVINTRGERYQDKGRGGFRRRKRPKEIAIKMQTNDGYVLLEENTSTSPQRKNSSCPSDDANDSDDDNDDIQILRIIKKGDVVFDDVENNIEKEEPMTGDDEDVENNIKEEKPMIGDDKGVENNINEEEPTADESKRNEYFFKPAISSSFSHLPQVMESTSWLPCAPNMECSKTSEISSTPNVMLRKKRSPKNMVVIRKLSRIMLCVLGKNHLKCNFHCRYFLQTYGTCRHCNVIVDRTKRRSTSWLESYGAFSARVRSSGILNDIQSTSAPRTSLEISEPLVVVKNEDEEYDNLHTHELPTQLQISEPLVVVKNEDESQLSCAELSANYDDELPFLESSTESIQTMSQGAGSHHELINVNANADSGSEPMNIGINHGAELPLLASSVGLVSTVSQDSGSHHEIIINENRNFGSESEQSNLCMNNTNITCASSVPVGGNSPMQIMLEQDVSCDNESNQVLKIIFEHNCTLSWVLVPKNSRRRDDVLYVIPVDVLTREILRFCTDMIVCYNNVINSIRDANSHDLGCINKILNETTHELFNPQLKVALKKHFAERYSSRISGEPVSEPSTESLRIVNELYVTQPLLKLRTCNSYGTALQQLRIFGNPEHRSVDISKYIEKVKYEVYIPGTAMRKTCRPTPHYRIVIFSDGEEMPTVEELDALQNKFRDKVPLLIAVSYITSIKIYKATTVLTPVVLDK